MRDDSAGSNGSIGSVRSNQQLPHRVPSSFYRDAAGGPFKGSECHASVIETLFKSDTAR